MTLDRGHGGTHRPAPGIPLVTLVVPDDDEALAFYVDVLGFALPEDTPLQAAKRCVVVARPSGRGAALLLARADGDRQRSRVSDQTGGRVAPFLVTDDFEREHTRMLGRGVRFLEAAHHECCGVIPLPVPVLRAKRDAAEVRNAGPL